MQGEHCGSGKGAVSSFQQELSRHTGSLEPARSSGCLDWFESLYRTRGTWCGRSARPLALPSVVPTLLSPQGLTDPPGPPGKPCPSPRAPVIQHQC